MLNFAIRWQYWKYGCVEIFDFGREMVLDAWQFNTQSAIITISILLLRCRRQHHDHLRRPNWRYRSRINNIIYSTFPQIQQIQTVLVNSWNTMSPRTLGPSAVTAVWRRFTLIRTISSTRILLLWLLLQFRTILEVSFTCTMEEAKTGLIVSLARFLFLN